MNINDCFGILEVSPECSHDEAKAAYRLMAQVWHPDKHAHNDKIHAKATSKQKEINAAWSTIEDYFKSLSARELERKEQEERERAREADRKERVDQEKRRNEASEKAESERRAQEEARYIKLSCPHCATVNRILRVKPLDTAKCGACKKILSVEGERAKEAERQANQRRDQAQREEQDRRQREANRQYKYTICRFCNNCNKMAIEKPINDAKCGTCGQSLSGHNGSMSPEKAREAHENIEYKYTLCKSCDHCNKVPVNELFRNTKCSNCNRSLIDHKGSMSPEKAKEREELRRARIVRQMEEQESIQKEEQERKNRVTNWFDTTNAILLSFLCLILVVIFYSAYKKL